MKYEQFIALLLQADATLDPDAIERALNADVQCFDCEQVIRAEQDFTFSQRSGELRCPYCGVLWVKFGRASE